jgi:hypothetical protein
MASSTTITIGPAAGGWRVSTSDDRLGGFFVSRKAALAFARDEALWAKQPPAVVETAPDVPTTRPRSH